MKPISSSIIRFGALTAVCIGTLLPQTPALGGQSSQSLSPAARDQARRVRFTHEGGVARETGPQPSTPAIEAPAGYDALTNGYDIQGPPYDTLIDANVVGLRSYNENRFIFEEVDTIARGLGPTYNAQSCRECHQNVVTGGASQVTEQRTGHLAGGQFFDSQGGSLIQSRATDPQIVELVAIGDNIRTFRISTNTLGDGYVEAISNSTILALRDAQPAAIRGTAVVVSVFEANSAARIGRFGWKCQHASLESFAGDAYLNEMGITSPMFPAENTSSGRDVSAYDPVPDPEDDGGDLKAFANFMRATKAPSRGPITPSVTSGEQVFNAIGCAACHVASLKTAPAGTVVNGGAMTIPAALGNKIIHPYSDFLMHDIGSGDGIPIQPTPEYASTANQIRTAPLWGLRTRNRLMHDGLSFSRDDAIQRHRGQAAPAERQYAALSSSDQQNLTAFLNSL
jgi:CxxC motif-containing protein (DUF1111 family)